LRDQTETYSFSEVSEVTHILTAIEQGDAGAADKLLPLVYEELRKLAAARMANERGTQTLQATALVHEAWLRLVGEGERTWQNRAQFFAAAAEAMRRILIDHARRKHALKRGAGAQPIDLDRVDVASEADTETLIRVNEALEKLAILDPQAAQVVKLRFFVGLDYVEAAKTLGISERSAKRCWTFARVWLYRELSVSATEVYPHWRCRTTTCTWRAISGLRVERFPRSLPGRSWEMRRATTNLLGVLLRTAPCSFPILVIRPPTTRWIALST
jgi:RNA polymerase sigma factor (TIGR02999 family)